MTALTTEGIGRPSGTVSGREIPGFRGEVIDPEHAGYNDARAVWNGTVDRRPRLIARCTGTADVAAAVRFARDRDLEIAVRGGGHNVAGTAVCDDGIVIDLSAMRAVSVNPGAPTRISPKVSQPRYRLRMISGVHRSAKSSAPRAIGQY